MVRLKPLLAISLVCGLNATHAMSEVLLGEPALAGSDFPRIIGGFVITEDEYTTYVRDCAVALFIMDQPINDTSQLHKPLTIKFFLKGAFSASELGVTFERYLELVQEECRKSSERSLADITLFLSQQAHNK